MRAWAAHTLFAAILIGSLATHEREVDPLADSSVSLEPAVVRVADSYGWRLLEHRSTTGIAWPTLVFEAPGCSRPIIANLLSLSFEQETIMRYAAEPGYTRRYIYFDRIWDRPHPREAFIQREKYAVLAMFGMTEYEPSFYLLSVETPPDCQAAGAIDWRPVWSRGYLKAAPANSAATAAKHQQL